MGHRHILAYKVLEDSGIGNVELMAVCDVNRANAEFAAREGAAAIRARAADLYGYGFNAQAR